MSAVIYQFRNPRTTPFPNPLELALRVAEAQYEEEKTNANLVALMQARRAFEQSRRR